MGKKRANLLQSLKASVNVLMLDSELDVNPVYKRCSLQGDPVKWVYRPLESHMGKQSHVFSLEMQVFQFLRTCGMCYIHFTVASEACMNIFFVYTWLERLQKSIKGKLYLRLSFQFKVILITEARIFINCFLFFFKMYLNILKWHLSVYR